MVEIASNDKEQLNKSALTASVETKGKFLERFNSIVKYHAAFLGIPTLLFMAEGFGILGVAAFARAGIMDSVPNALKDTLVAIPRGPVLPISLAHSWYTSMGAFCSTLAVGCLTGSIADAVCFTKKYITPVAHELAVPKK